MIIDSHSHAWDQWPYDPPVPDHDSRGRVEQLLHEMDANGVDQAVLVAARIDHNPGNNDYVAGVVREYPDRLHQFADVDCQWTDQYHTPGAADRLAQTADELPIRGFTHYVNRENDGWFLSDEGMAFFGVAAERNLVASIAASPNWQADLREVARTYPTLPILCHHLAGIDASEPPPFEGLREVLASAELDNILIKVSGFYYASRTTWDFPFSDVHWMVRELYEHFGPHRLCWGSDYPVVRRAMTYTQAIEVVRSHLPFVPDDDMSSIMGDTLDHVLQTGRPVGIT